MHRLLIAQCPENAVGLEDNGAKRSNYQVLQVQCLQKPICCDTWPLTEYRNKALKVMKHDARLAFLLFGQKKDNEAVLMLFKVFVMVLYALISRGEETT